MRRTATITMRIIYTALVVAVVAFALLFMGTKIDVLGYEVKVVKSGSMEPAIPTGSIVVVAPAETYRVGDVVTFGRDTDGRIPVTHRIVEKTGEGASASYVTKGDANENMDGRTVAHGSVIGKVFASIPYAGFVIEFARTPLGFALLIGLPAMVIVLDEFANIMWEYHKYRFRKRKGAVGYRTPSRDRQPRDFGKKKPQLVPPGPRRGKQFVRSPKDFVLDLRNYRPNRRVV